MGSGSETFQVEFHLLTDPSMHLRVESGIRGGICTEFHRYAKANKQAHGEEYDPNLPSKYLMYVDANNLYGLGHEDETACA